MLCDNCNHKHVCKHYEYLCKYNGLHLFNCEYSDQNKTNTIRITPDSDPMNNIALLNNSKEKNEAKIVPLKNIPELKVCNCGAKTYNELYKCVRCGETICDSCCYFGDSDISPSGDVTVEERLCESCYEELFADEIAEEPDNTSLFDTLTSGFEQEGRD